MCTRILWSSQGALGAGTVLVARNMDWYQDIPSELWALPPGTDRSGMVKDNPHTWKSLYGSVITLTYGGTGDGVNTAGLNANGLYLTEADYGERDASRPGLGLPICLQFFLDSFANVADAVAWARDSNFQVVPTVMGGKPGTNHMSLADATGDSAILEFIDGKLQIHHDSKFQFMTNSPVFTKQLELLKHYVGFGGNRPLPGSTDSRDRFVRAAHYTKHLPQTSDLRTAIAEVLSVSRNAAAPFGEADPTRPYISTTRWSTVSDLTNRTYYFESSTSPNLVWVKLDALDFGDGAKPRRLDLVNKRDLVGDVTEQFELAEGPPFARAEDA